MSNEFRNFEAPLHSRVLETLLLAAQAPFEPRNSFIYTI